MRLRGAGVGALLAGGATARVVGAVAAALARAGGARVEVLEVRGGPGAGAARLRVAAGGRLRLHARGGTTWGDVLVVAALPPVGDPRRAALLRHEAVHVAQWRRWGWAFPVLYLAAELLPDAAGGRGGAHNRFEVAAGLADGGYA